MTYPQSVSYVTDWPSIDVGEQTLQAGDAFVRPPGSPITIDLEWLPLNFGGSRPYFLCPACSKRCRKLYHYACRDCRGARYRCKSENPRDRAIRRAIRHREKFGQVEGGLLVPFPSKPYNMTWEKYFKGWDESDRLDQIVFGMFKLPEPDETRK